MSNPLPKRKLSPAEELILRKNTSDQVAMFNKRPMLTKNDFKKYFTKSGQQNAEAFILNLKELWVSPEISVNRVRQYFAYNLLLRKGLK